MERGWAGWCVVSYLFFFFKKLVLIHLIDGFIGDDTPVVSGWVYLSSALEGWRGLAGSESPLPGWHVLTTCLNLICI
jgi:hypothetical protein